MIAGLQSHGVMSPHGSSSVRDGRSSENSHGESLRLRDAAMVRDQHVEGVAERARRENELGYTDEEQRRLDKLRERDQEVRMHEGHIDFPRFILGRRKT